MILRLEQNIRPLSWSLIMNRQPLKMLVRAEEKPGPRIQAQLTR